MAGADDQRRHLDRREVSGPVPVREAGIGADAEFARALHRHVNRRVDVVEPALYRIWPVGHGHPQHVMDVVLLEQQLHVPRVFRLARCLKRLDLGQCRLVHLRHQHLLGVGVVGRHAEHHVGDDKAAQVLLVAQGVLGGEDAAPRLAVEDEIAGVQPECPADLLDFVHEAVKVPQRRLGGLVTATRAELVVVVILHAGGRQVAVAGLQVLMGCAGPAVQQQHFEIGIVAGPLHPDAVTACRGADRDQPGAAAQHIVPAGVIQVTAHRTHQLPRFPQPQRLQARR